MAATIVKTINIGSITTAPWGLTFDGKYLWLIDSNLFSGNTYRISTQGTLINTVNMALGLLNRGIAFDGKYIYKSDFAQARFGKFHMNGTQIFNYLGIITPNGMTFDGKQFWIVSATNIIQFDINTNTIKTIAVGGTDNEPQGITFDGRYLWWTGTQNNIIVQMDIAGNIIKTIGVGATDNDPRGITTDGKYLWWVGGQNNILVQMTKA